MFQFTDMFRVDHLSIFVGVFSALFALLSVIYSFAFMRGRKKLARYYLYLLLTLIVSLGCIFADNLLFLSVCWGFLGLLLYLLIAFGEGKRTSYTAKKTFIIIGGTDALMLLGIALIWHLSRTLEMSEISIHLNSKAAISAYLCLAIAAFAKAGAMPFHTWIPDTAEDAPVPVVAYLPAALDKLLGIYFLFRISAQMFVMDAGMNTFLMALGSFTIVAAVMMALIQHDLKRLLGYHAVSQVGYMVLGLGTGNPIGIAGGLFHMLNHAIYKSCLFLSGGAVEKRFKTTNLEKLGGIAKVMPLTFITFLIAALAISGVPPFNGFASKWMIYQGIINSGKTGGSLWILWLICAMFGSALTMASFMKLINAVFLGQPHESLKLKTIRRADPPPSMYIPMCVLAALCVLFGVFAYRLPLHMFILPCLGRQWEGIVFSGAWQPLLATGLLLLGIVIGFVVYLFGKGTKIRRVEPFIGGETLEEHPDMRISGTEFYNTVRDMESINTVYKLADKKLFDIYELGSKITFGFNAVLRYIHNGILPSYLSWCLLGMIILLKSLFFK